MTEVKIRAGKKHDVSHVLDLIRELAVYEKASDEVSNTIEMMEEDGFGDHPIYGLIVAEIEEKIIGVSIHYFRYSTWKGRQLYLEDLVVTETARGKGVGAKLFEATIQFAKENQCEGLSWQVLDWNEPAINFYKKYNAKFDGEWLNCSIIIDWY